MSRSLLTFGLLTLTVGISVDGLHARSLVAGERKVGLFLVDAMTARSLEMDFVWSLNLRQVKAATLTRAGQEALTLLLAPIISLYQQV